MSLRRCFGWVPRELRLAITLAGLLVGVLFLGPSFSLAHVAEPRYIAPNGTDSGDCTNSGTPCATPQYAVDVAAPGDEIRLAAGTYTDVQMRADITQTVYLSKTVTIRGGYTTTNWTTPDPVAHPTTLDAQGRGRVLYITGNISATIEGLRLINGDAMAAGERYSADESGGGIYSITATTTLRDNWILSNQARGAGGVSILFGTARLDRNTIAQNHTASGGSGGGIGLVLGTAVLEGNLIISNTARYEGFPFPAPSRGGGLAVIDSNVTLRGNTIAGNNAFREGGGLDVAESTITMTGNLVADNRVESTTGVGGGLFLRLSHGAVTTNTITSNVAFGAGGGVYFLGSSNILVRNNTISGNAATSGGGITFNGSDNKLENNLITHNHAMHGGGVDLGYSSPSLVNTVIADNTADTGSGAYVINGMPQFVQTTIARNTASNGSGGNGIYMLAGNGYTVSLTLINTILVNHSVGISATTETTVTLNGVLWFGNGINIGGSGTTTVTNAATGDPAFAPDGYHLTACSAARGRGIDAGVTTDIDGDPRPHDAIDLGADQFVAVRSTCRKVYLPMVGRS